MSRCSSSSQGTWSAGGDFDWGQRSAASSTANSGASTRHHQHSYHHYPPSHHQHVFNHDQQHHQPMGGAGIHLGSDPYGQHTGVIKQEASGRSTPPVPIPSSYYGPPYALPHASLEVWVCSWCYVDNTNSPNYLAFSRIVLLCLCRFPTRTYVHER